MSDIEYVEAQGNYVCLFSSEGEDLLRETMNSVGRQLDPNEFVRVHRRYIVRRDCVAEVEGQSSGEYVIHLRGGQRLVSGRTYKRNVARLLRPEREI